MVIGVEISHLGPCLETFLMHDFPQYTFYSIMNQSVELSSLTKTLFTYEFCPEEFPK